MWGALFMMFWASKYTMKKTDCAPPAVALSIGLSVF